MEFNVFTLSLTDNLQTILNSLNDCIEQYHSNVSSGGYSLNSTQEGHQDSTEKASYDHFYKLHEMLWQVNTWENLNKQFSQHQATLELSKRKKSAI